MPVSFKLRSHSNSFSFPSISLSRTGSDKSHSPVFTGADHNNSSSKEKSPLASKTGTGSVFTSTSHSVLPSIAPLNAIISAILHGYFLQLSEANIDTLIQALAGQDSTVLETIDIKSAAISATDTQLLGKLIRSSDAANIKVLKLDRNAISQGAYKYLFEAWKYNKTITTLSMSRSGVNDKSIKHIAKILAKNEVLKELDLSNNRITAQGIGTLCEALLYNRVLTRLCVQSNNIKKEGAQSLANLLTKNKVLRHLNVGSNGLGSEGCIMVANAVRYNRALTSLSLDMNEMGPMGATAIAAALASNRHLLYLYIPHNNIGDQGLVDLCGGLMRNNHIVGLDLELNHIGSGQSGLGMRALADVLKKNTSLRELNLSYNLFSSEAIRALMGGMAMNSTLESIMFTNCCIGTESAISIAQVLQSASGLQNLGLTANPDIAVEGYWALATSLSKNRSMKGMQLDYNSEDRHELYESIQYSLTRNFIWQQAIYSAACCILTLSRIVLLGRPLNPKLLLSQQLIQQQQNVGRSGGAWKLLKRVGLNRSHSGTSTSSSFFNFGRTKTSGDQISAATATPVAPSNGADAGDGYEGPVAVEGYVDVRNLAHDNSSARSSSSAIVRKGSNAGDASTTVNTNMILPQPYRKHLVSPTPPPLQQLFHPMDQSYSAMAQHSPVPSRPHSPVLSHHSSSPQRQCSPLIHQYGFPDYNAHRVMANLGNMPYEIFERICAYLDPAQNMSIAEIRTAIQMGSEKSTLTAYYTKARMLERIFQRRYIPPVGIRYSVKNGDERQ
ncbi:hypothetical protein EDD11_001711 [Mortierella claussenii]|nr:hypothetical protein EDD11_001711 [Mortierella claussenii]